MFATLLYAGIASARSVDSALRQAKAIMQPALAENADLPEHAIRANVDTDAITLVRPTGA